MIDFQNISLTKILGQENTKAEQLAKLAALGEQSEGQTVKIRFMEIPTIQYLEGSQLNDIEGIDGAWLEPIYEYIKNGKLPADKQ